MDLNVRKIALFLGITFSASWLVAGLFYALGGRLGTPAGFAVAAAYMLVPAGAAVLVQKVFYKEGLREPLGISFRPNRWFLVAWLLPPVFAFAAFGVSLLMPGVEYSPGMEGMFERFGHLLAPEDLEKMKAQAEALPFHPVWLGLATGLFAGVTVNAVFGFGEELGWRGLLQKELSPLGFWRASLATGIVWGVWHAPFIVQGHNYPEHPVAGVFMMTAWCVLLAPAFGYVRARANSVVAAAVLHGTLNGTVGLAMVVVRGGSDLTVGGTGLAGFIALILLNSGLVIHDRFLAAEPIMVRKPARSAPA